MGRPRKRSKVTDASEEALLLHRERSEPPLWHGNVPNADHLGWDDQHRGTIDYISSHEHVTQPARASSAEGPPHGPFGSLDDNLDDMDCDGTPLSNSPVTPPLSDIAENFPATLGWNNSFDMFGLSSTAPNPACRGASLLNRLTPTSPPPPPITHHSSVNSSTPTSISPLPITPSCTCLPDLYLTLSNLSIFSSLPMNPNTVENLQTAARTAHAVLYCPVCPRKFQSGMQNVMLLGTLLTVIVDGWARILRTPAKDLARGFDLDPATTISTSTDLDSTWSDAQEIQWKLFAHYLVRQHLYGDAPPPGIHIPGICPFLSTISPKPPLIILNNLCNAMERRQKTWHGLIDATGEFPIACNKAEAVSRLTGRHCTEEEQLQRLREVENETEQHLCLKIVDSVRKVLASVDGRPCPGQGHVERAVFGELLGR
jgi:hypothetical protein